MKAMVYHEYGLPEVLQLQELDTPAPKEDEFRVNVRAASVNWLDWHFLTGKPFMARLMAGGFLKPKNGILGVDFAGTVDVVGNKIAQYQPGDEVFGTTKRGCFAEYVCVREEEVQPKPANLTFEEAASVGAAASVALLGLRDVGQIKPKQNVVINGASGGVGTFAVQIAKSYATEVTAVCSASNLDLVRSIGADHALDYTREDFTRGGQQYDLIFDVVAKLSFSGCQRVLKPEGIYVTTEFSPGLAMRGWWTALIGGKKVAPVPPKAPTRSDLAFVRELLEAGKIKPVIDKRYLLGELPEALRYLEVGHARGKIVIGL